MDRRFGARGGLCCTLGAGFLELISFGPLANILDREYRGSF